MDIHTVSPVDMGSGLFLPNDTYVEQLTAAAQAALKDIVARGSEI